MNAGLEAFRIAKALIPEGPQVPKTSLEAQ